MDCKYIYTLVLLCLSYLTIQAQEVQDNPKGQKKDSSFALTYSLTADNFNFLSNDSDYNLSREGVASLGVVYNYGKFGVKANSNLYTNFDFKAEYNIWRELYIGASLTVLDLWDYDYYDFGYDSFGDINQRSYSNEISYLENILVGASWKPLIGEGHFKVDLGIYVGVGNSDDYSSSSSEYSYDSNKISEISTIYDIDPFVNLRFHCAIEYNIAKKWKRPLALGIEYRKDLSLGGIDTEITREVREWTYDNVVYREIKSDNFHLNANSIEFILKWYIR